ncbi:hypothetical protein FIV31_00410 [Coxiella endosymbiont of Ornithodoros amblus]|nr:hypothetical protein [Coxiella endosymbiont of Ornithodoros amblus]
MQGDRARLAPENFSGVFGKFSPQDSPSPLLYPAVNLDVKCQSLLSLITSDAVESAKPNNEILQEIYA